MKLELTYPEMALIREVISKHLHEMGSKFIAVNGKKATFAKIQKFMDEWNAERNPHCPEGLCGIILDKIEAVEDRIRESISG